MNLAGYTFTFKRRRGRTPWVRVRFGQRSADVRAGEKPAAWIALRPQVLAVALALHAIPEAGRKGHPLVERVMLETLAGRWDAAFPHGVLWVVVMLRCPLMGSEFGHRTARSMRRMARRQAAEGLGPVTVFRRNASGRWRRLAGWRWEARS